MLGGLLVGWLVSQSVLRSVGWWQVGGTDTANTRSRKSVCTTDCLQTYQNMHIPADWLAVTKRRFQNRFRLTPLFRVYIDREVGYFRETFRLITIQHTLFIEKHRKRLFENASATRCLLRIEWKEHVRPCDGNGRPTGIRQPFLPDAWRWRCSRPVQWGQRDVQQSWCEPKLAVCNSVCPKQRGFHDRSWAYDAISGEQLWGEQLREQLRGEILRDGIIVREHVGKFNDCEPLGKFRALQSSCFWTTQQRMGMGRPIRDW